ncbi:MAG: hypothetical protein IPO65_05175 [Saprospiraceae bacterium]|nr:hypothetical protein [Saprospiraceae bacterium]
MVDLDGQSPLSFRGIRLDSFFVAVRHRSHLGVMSLKQYRNQMVDFTDPALPVFDFGVRLNGIYDFAGKAQNTKVKQTIGPYGRVTLMAMVKLNLSTHLTIPINCILTS